MRVRATIKVSFRVHLLRLLRFFQAYCTLVVRYCYVTGGIWISFEISISTGVTIATAFREITVEFKQESESKTLKCFGVGVYSAKAGTEPGSKISDSVVRTPLFHTLRLELRLLKILKHQLPYLLTDQKLPELYRSRNVGVDSGRSLYGKLEWSRSLIIDHYYCRLYFTKHIIT